MLKSVFLSSTVMRIVLDRASRDNLAAVRSNGYAILYSTNTIMTYAAGVLSLRQSGTLLELWLLGGLEGRCPSKCYVSRLLWRLRRQSSRETKAFGAAGCPHPEGTRRRPKP